MIYDCKETYIDDEKIFRCRGKSVEKYQVNYEDFEEGKRYLKIPEGMVEVLPSAFSEYNGSAVVQEITRKLALPEYHLNEWKKRLRRKQLIKIKFPQEIGKDISARAAYMLRKEMRVRMLKLFIPASVVSISAEAFPVLLEAIEVDRGNACYVCKDGVLFSKDMKNLIRYPGYREDESYEIPKCVEKVQSGAFENAFLKKVIIPSSIASFEKGAFSNSIIGELVFSEGCEGVEEGVFSGCRINRIVFPKSFRMIGNHAFKGTVGIEDIECISNEIKLGIGVFSYGKYKDITWWPWEMIPKATFLNSEIDEIDIPTGVEYIADYAFAGCYKAKKINIPESVTHIGLHSFDEGFSYSGNITVPEGIYHFCYRFPVLSRINRKEKHEIWEMRTKKSFEEETYILEQRLRDIDECEKRLNALQIPHKKMLKRERENILAILK